MFDPKPKLNELHGQKLPESLTKNVRFAFLKKDTATLLGTKRKFHKHGQCGMELSELIPHIGSVADDLLLVRSMHTDQFNHHPGPVADAVRPGQLRPAEHGLVAHLWTGQRVAKSARLRRAHRRPRFQRRGLAVAERLSAVGLFRACCFATRASRCSICKCPPACRLSCSARGSTRWPSSTPHGSTQVHDPEIASRIASYELAFRMQSAAPELIDLAGETQATLDMYGVDRKEPEVKASRGGGPGQFRSFAANCLLARRMVERGVRFVNIIHASWDHHSNLDVELPFNAEMADQPIAALIKDLKQRGLLDETLVVWGSEFGRTPLGENRGGSEMVTGRDHHPFAFSIFMAGGGIQGRPGLWRDRRDRLGAGRRIRSTSTIFTPRCCTCSASTTCG